jgi:ribosomal protein L21E
MKVGDLVEMSSAGKKVQAFASFKDKWGMVIGRGQWSWNVSWNAKNGQHKAWMKRSHIKHLKAN